MKCIHIALVVADLQASIKDYSHRLGAEPICIVPETYALWRTPLVNLSISVKPEEMPGSLRHLGFEDPVASHMSEQQDCNGLIWERFSAEQQKIEILNAWPQAEYKGNK